MAQISGKEAFADVFRMTETKESKKSADLDPGSWYFIRIPPRASKYEPLDVVVIINGQRWDVRRGEAVCLPHCVLHSLDNTQYPHWELQEAEEGKPRMVGEVRFRISYEFIRAASEEEMDRWWNEILGRPRPRLAEKLRTVKKE
jgi:hypothetical protein